MSLRKKRFTLRCQLTFFLRRPPEEEDPEERLPEEEDPERPPEPPEDDERFPELPERLPEERRFPDRPEDRPSCVSEEDPRRLTRSPVPVVPRLVP